MPYKRVGKTVYVKKGGKWKVKGRSISVSKAKRYIRKLHMVSGH